MNKLDELNNWKQSSITHCPRKGCKGMLLDSEDTFILKCSDCKKYWYSKTEWIEYKTRKTKMEIKDESDIVLEYTEFLKGNKNNYNATKKWVSPLKKLKEYIK